MKHLFYLITFLFFTNAASLSAQMSVSNPPTPPDLSAMMDIKSPNKGLLIPRVASTAAITNPAQTLMIWSIADNAYMYYEGTKWKRILDEPRAKGLISDSLNVLRTIFNTFPNTYVKTTTFNSKINLLNTRIDSARIAAVKISNDNDLLQDALIKKVRDSIAILKNGLVQTNNNVSSISSQTTQNATNIIAINANVSTLQGQVANTWKTTGNAGTTAGVNFIGTTDNQPLEFRVNNERVGSLTGVGKYNIAFGKDALISNGGIQNVAIGLNSLKNNTGLQNTAVGTYTLANNTSGYLNAAFGHGAIQQANGIENTAFGSYTFGDLINGNKNTALGAYSGGNVTNSYSGTFIGHGAGVTVNGTAKSLAIGADAKVDCSNCGNINVQKLGIGVSNPTETLEVPGKTKTQDLQVTTGAAIGKILTSDASGNATWQSPAAANAWGLNGNVGTGTEFIGTTNDVPLVFKQNNEVITRFTTNNISIGKENLINNVIGYNNVGIGGYALQMNTNGFHNVAIGVNALRPNNFSANTAVGVGALNFFGTGNLSANFQTFNSAYGAYSFNYLEFGYNNTAIGSKSGSYDPLVKTLNEVTCIGVSARATVNGISNSIAIGYDATVDASNITKIGNPNTATATIFGQQQTGSDIRLKDHIAANPYGLNLIKQIPTYTYEYKTVPGRTRIGIMAQDLAVLERKMGVKFPFLETPTDLENGRYAVSYTELITPLIEATKDLSKLNDAQQVKIDDLQKQLDKQARDIEELKAMMIALSKK